VTLVSNRALAVVPPAAPFREVADELIRLSSARSEVQPRGTTARLAAILIGLELELVDTARACLLLLDNGFADASLPLARKCFEYGVVAQYLNLTRDTEAYFDVSDDIWRKIDREQRNTGLPLPPELTAQLDRNAPAPPGAATLKRFEQVCAAFEGSGLYLLYRHMSSSVHPWLPGTLRWLTPDDNPIGLRFVQGQTIGHVAVLWPLVAGLLWVGRAVDLLTTHKPRQSALKAAGRRVEIPTVLKGRPLHVGRNR
jgi:hypothetical protein